MIQQTTESFATPDLTAASCGPEIPEAQCFRILSRSRSRGYIRFHYVNAGGIRSKIPIFFASPATCDHDVIVVTETWLVSSVLDAELTPPGWFLFQRDRHSAIDATGYGGGVIILVRAELRPSLVLSSDSIELLWVKLALGNQKVMVSAAYIPPRSDRLILSEALRRVRG